MAGGDEKNGLAAVAAFYRLLAEDELLNMKARSFQQLHTEQEKVIECFIALGLENGFEFTTAELMEFILENGEAATR